MSSSGKWSPDSYPARIAESVSLILGSASSLPDGSFDDIVSTICQEFASGGDPSVIRARINDLVIQEAAAGPPAPPPTPSGGGLTVLAFYKSNAGVLLSAGTTIMQFQQMVTDTDSAVTTGAAWKFTVPVGKGGIYTVCGAIIAPGPAPGTGFDPELFKNNAVDRILSRANPNDGGAAIIVPFAASILLAAGDFVDVRVELLTAQTAQAGSWISIAG